jgi:signal peptidase
MAIEAVAAPTPRRLRVEVALGVLGSAAFGLLVGTLLAALLATQFFGYRILTVESFSMEPALRRGDVIVSRPANIADIKVGQIALFEQGQVTRILVAHRVTGFVNATVNIHNSETGEDTQEHQRLLQTKGDANTAADGNAVSAVDLRGRLWFTIPRIGVILNKIPLQVVLLGVAAGTGALWAVYELARARRRRNESPGE